MIPDQPNLMKAMGLSPDKDLVTKAKRGDESAFNQLLERHYDLISKKAQAYSSAPVPQSVIKAQAIKIFKGVIDRYDPSSDANFRTFLESNLRLSRFVNQTKNVARIPEHRFLMLSRYVTTKEILKTEKDREPTPTEMAEALHISVSDATELEKAVSRKELSTSGMTFDQVGAINDRFKDSLEFIYFVLTPQEQLVFDYSLGAHGKPRLDSVTEIMRKTGLTQDKVYAIKRDLAKKLQQAR